MSRWVRGGKAFAVMCLLAFTASCESGPHLISDVEFRDTDEPVLSPDAVVVDSTSYELLPGSSNREAGTLVFQRAGNAPPLRPGEVIVGAQDGGFLGRVRSVDEFGSEIRVQVDPASLDEAVENGSFRNVMQLSASPVHPPFSAEGVPAPAPIRMELAEGVDVTGSGEYVIDELQLWRSGTGPYRVTLNNVRVRFSPEVETDFKIHWGGDSDRIRHVRVVGSGELELGAEIRGSLGAQASMGDTLNFALAAWPFYGSIGVLPVVGQVELGLALHWKVSGGAAGTLRAGFNTTSQVETGFEYAGGEWRTIHSQNQESTPVGPEWSVTGRLEAELEVRPTLTVTFYGTVSGWAAGVPYVRYLGELQVSQCRWTQDLSVGLDAEVGVRLEVLSKTLQSYTYRAIGPRRSLLNQQGDLRRTLTRAGGHDQSGSAEVFLSQPLRVQVMDHLGRPAPGVPVTFQVTAGGGSVSDPTALTDSDGIATTRWRVGTSGAQRVRAQSGGCVDGTAEFTASVLTPGTPSLQSPNDGATGQPTSPTLRWGSVASASSYDLQVSRNSSFSSTDFNGSVASTSRTISNLLSGTTYHWRVRARNEHGAGAWSSVRRFTTQAGPTVPSAPALQSPSDGASSQPTSPTLRWSSVASASSYDLQVSTNSSFSSTVFNGSVTSTSRGMTNLPSSTTHYWRVRARNQQGPGAWSSVWRFTTQAGPVVPSAPVLVSPPNGATNVQFGATDDSGDPAVPYVMLRWRPATGADQDSHAGEVSTSLDFSTGVIAGQGLHDFGIVTGLQGNTRYYWRVRGRSSAGWGPWSAVWSFTTGPRPSTAPPPPGQGAGTAADDHGPPRIVSEFELLQMREDSK